METYYDYLREFAPEIGAHIVKTYPPLQNPQDPIAPGIEQLLRTPLPAQALAISGLVKYLRKHRSTRIVADCGTGKTLMSLGLAHAHAAGRPYACLVMAPPHITHKWAREAHQTIPGARTFLIEDMRNGGDPKANHGIVELKLKGKQTVVSGLRTTLSELRAMGREGWRKQCPGPAFFILGREKGKLGYYWRHSYAVARTGPDFGGLINPDTGRGVFLTDDSRLSHLDVEDVKVHEQAVRPKGGTTVFSPLWQADRTKIQRTAPLDFISRYMKGWWDYAIADELHQLAGDTVQGNGLGVLYRCARKQIALTGTLMGGYADDLFNIFFRMEPATMTAAGFSAGGQGRRDFQEQYGVLETVEKVREEEKACSRASRRSVQIIRKPGASPLLFGNFLMESTAFITLEDISSSLPPYEESVLQVKMDEDLGKVYGEIRDEIAKCMEQHRGNKSLMSVMLNTLMLYPDHPYGLGEIWGKEYDPLAKKLMPFLITSTPDLPEERTYAKEQALVEDIRAELRAGRRCQVYATYTGKRDVTARLLRVLQAAGMRTAVLRSSVPTEKRELWYEKQLQAGVEVVVCHPKLVETGLDLLSFPTLYFYETGYSLHTLRQASRRSWRLGQKHPVKVKFLAYQGTMQEVCLRLMGKKMLVAQMMEGKFSGEGLQSLDAEQDMLTAMARELVEKGGVGESAAAVWSSLHHDRSAPAPPAPAREPEAEVPELLDFAAEAGVANSIVESRESRESPSFTGLLDFSIKPEQATVIPFPAARRRRAAMPLEGQMALFA